MNGKMVTATSSSTVAGSSMVSPETNADLRVKHLEMTQAVISRLAGSGATIKNYCLTLSTAIAGLSATLQRPVVALLAIPPIVVFAVLDTQYLLHERRFRNHYDAIRSEDWASTPSFNMTPTPQKGFWPAFFSWSVFTFYATLAASVLVVASIMEWFHGWHA